MEEVDTPLQEKLTVLADNIGYGGMVAAAGTFVAMIAMFYLDPAGREGPDTTVWDVALKAFIMAVTIVVVAVPEGLPLAVTLSLAFSTQVLLLALFVYHTQSVPLYLYESTKHFSCFSDLMCLENDGRQQSHSCVGCLRDHGQCHQHLL